MNSATSGSHDRIINVGPAGFHPPSAVKLGVEMPKDGKTVRLTGTQIRANGGIERVDPRAVSGS